MAKINYQQVGWDTTKYFNPTNMNHMDDGIKAACDKSDANETAIADVNNKLGNTDISAIGDGTLTGGLDALNSNLKTSDNIILKCGTARKSGNTVQLDILFDGTISGGTHGGTMPIGYRPRNLACSPIVCGPSLNSIGRVEVNSTGEIYLYSHIEIQYARGIVTYCI